MADIIDYRILGEEMQMVEIEMAPGEGIRAEAGAMLFMEEGGSKYLKEMFVRIT